MTGIWVIYRRELLSLWVTPLAWVLVSVFLVLQGTVYYSIVSHFSSMPQLGIDYGPVQAYFGQTVFVLVSLLLLCPALTMRTIAEERRSGTLETLLTAPVTAAGVVLGKYFAVFTTYLMMWTPTVLYLIILRDTGIVDWQVVAASYLGVTGIGAGYLAVGVLMSAVTKSQLVAVLLTMLVAFGLFVLGVGQYVFEPGLAQTLSSYVSLQDQLEELSRGIVDMRRLVFDLSLVALPLFMAVRIVDSWRWE
jgi:ABC-2 type transport system permease protein